MQKLTLKHINYYIKNEDMLNCAASIRIEGMAIGMIKKMKRLRPTMMMNLMYHLLKWKKKLRIKSTLNYMQMS